MKLNRCIIFGKFRQETEFSLDDIQMDSEQPIESPGSSMDMPDSPTSAYGPPSVQSSAYMPAQKREAAKVK